MIASAGRQPTMHTLPLDAVQTPPAKASAEGKVSGFCSSTAQEPTAVFRHLLVSAGVSTSKAHDMWEGVPTSCLTWEVESTLPNSSLAWACAGGHQNPGDQAGLQARAAKEAAVHVFGRTTSGEKTVHDIATPDVKQRMADSTALLSADAAHKALDVRHRPVMPHVHASRSPSTEPEKTQFYTDRTSIASSQFFDLTCSSSLSDDP